jgi:hypothetical protein
LVALCCFPPMTKLLYPHLFPIDHTQILVIRTVWLPWTEFARIISEVFLALFVGGQVFNDWVRDSIRDNLRKLQELFDSAATNEAEDLRTRMNEALDELIDWLVGGRGLRHKIRRFRVAFASVLELKDAVWRDIRWLYPRLLMIRIYYLFPGGIYGLVAYLSFAVILLSKCFKYYLDFGITR